MTATKGMRTGPGWLAGWLVERACGWHHWAVVPAAFSAVTAAAASSSRVEGSAACRAQPAALLCHGGPQEHKGAGHHNLQICLLTVLFNCLSLLCSASTLSSRCLNAIRKGGAAEVASAATALGEQQLAGSQQQQLLLQQQAAVIQLLYACVLTAMY